MDKECAYCGDKAEFGRLDGTLVFCDICASLATINIVPHSTRHYELRPYNCNVCGRRTGSPVACPRKGCLEASQN